MNLSQFTGNELKYLEMVMNQESWSATGGSWNHTLEQEFCKKFEVKYAIAMNSGTAPLHAALVAAGIGPGDEVISPALTVIMDSAATLHAGATPVYADVDPDTFNIDPKDIARKITSKTKAIIAVALYGLSPHMDEIMGLAEAAGLIVIEDNAEHYPSDIKGHFASYSFEASKHISCGEGGMLVTNNEKYAERARKVSGHGYKSLTASDGRVKLNEDEFQNPKYKRHEIIGWNYRMPEFNAAIALAQLERIEALIFMRQESAKYLKEAMAGCDYLIPQMEVFCHPNTYYTLGVRYEGKDWEGFRKAYIANGGDGFYGAWSVPYLEPALADLYKGDCPVAESLQPKLMQFKTNYRDLAVAAEKADALYKTIKGVK